jgi:hypothetical protein
MCLSQQSPANLSVFLRFNKSALEQNSKTASGPYISYLRRPIGVHRYSFCLSGSLPKTSHINLKLLNT